MRQLMYILMAGLLLVSCVDQNSSKDKGNSEKHDVERIEMKEKTSTPKDHAKKSHDIINRQVNSTNKVKPAKLKKEKNKQIESTKRIVLQNQTIPSIRIDSVGERIKEVKNLYFEMPCNDEKYKMLNQFSIELNKQYPNSSDNTEKYDGKIFCLRQLEVPNTENSIIIFGRNEGGHTSDGTTLISFNNQHKLMYTLPLSYKTGWDGHETIVKSSIKKNLITREIEERFGWSNMHPDSLSKQPRRVVTQEIILKKDGRMEVLNENVRKFNFDKLL